MSEQRQIEQQDIKKVVPPSAGDQRTRNSTPDVFNNPALDALLDAIDRVLKEQGDLAEHYIQRSGE